jgi:hypothetical protein
MFSRRLFLRPLLLVGAIVTIGILGGSALTRDARGATETVAPSTTSSSGDRADRLGFRPRLGRHVVHAVVTVERDGALLTFQVDRGTVASIAGGKLSVSEKGGASVTIATNEQIRVRRDGKKIALTDLKSGDEVYVISQVPASGDPVAIRIAAPTRQPSGT